MERAPAVYSFPTSEVQYKCFDVVVEGTQKQGPKLVFPSEKPFFGKKELLRVFPVPRRATASLQGQNDISLGLKGF